MKQSKMDLRKRRIFGLKAPRYEVVCRIETWGTRGGGEGAPCHFRGWAGSYEPVSVSKATRGESPTAARVCKAANGNSSLSYEREGERSSRGFPQTGVHGPSTPQFQHPSPTETGTGFRSWVSKIWGQEKRAGKPPTARVNPSKPWLQPPK